MRTCAACCVCVCMCVCLHVCACVRVCALARVRACVEIRWFAEHIHTHRMGSDRCSMCLEPCVCVHVCIYGCIYVYVYGCIYGCIYVCARCCCDGVRVYSVLQMLCWRGESLCVMRQMVLVCCREREKESEGERCGGASVDAVWALYIEWPIRWIAWRTQREGMCCQCFKCCQCLR